MLLSICNLFDWLSRKGYNVRSDIHTGPPILSGVRLLNNYYPEQDQDDVAFIGPSEDFMNSPSPGTIVCCKNDIIYIDEIDTELIFNECIRAFEFFNQWEIALLEAVIQDSNLNTFITLGHQVFQSPMFISGANGQTYAITSQYDPSIHPIWKQRLENGNLSFDFINQYHEGDYFQEMYSSTYPQISVSPIWGGEILFSNLRTRNERIGSVIIYEYGHKFHQGDVHLLHVYAKIIEKALALHPTQYFSLSELENLAFHLLDEKDTNWETAYNTLRADRWKYDHRFLVICSSSPSGIDSVIIGRLRDIIKSKYNGICTVLYDGNLLVIINLNLRNDYHTVISDMQTLTKNKLIFGISYPFLDFANLKLYYQQALLSMQTAKSQKKTLMDFEEIFSSALRKNLPTNSGLSAMVHPDILLLLSMDRKNSTDYATTLYVYLLCGCNSRETARILSIHRNTLLYRMDKIRTFCTLSLDNLQNRQILFISLVFSGFFLN